MTVRELIQFLLTEDQDARVEVCAQWGNKTVVLPWTPLLVRRQDFTNNPFAKDFHWNGKKFLLLGRVD